ncbi:chaplin [Nostoc sp. C052]|nr:chaplin [Nostoc sp. C052]
MSPVPFDNQAFAAESATKTQDVSAKKSSTTVVGISASASVKKPNVSSPGVLSGNLVQVPVHVPVNVCGNSVNVIGLLNPAFGNSCVDSEDPKK